MQKLLMMTFLGLVLGAMGAVPIVDLKLNEGDFKAIRHAGTAQNQPVTFLNPEYAEWVEGPNGKAIQFKNDGPTPTRAAVVIPKFNAVFNAASPFTVTMRIKTPSNIIRTRRYILMHFSDTDSWGPGFRIGMSFNMFNFSLGNNERKGAVPGISTKVAKLAIKPDTWYDLACVYDGTSIKLYVDGTLHAEGNFTCHQPVRRNDLFIGASTPRGTGYGFDGVISTVRIYANALSAAEIAALSEE